MNDYTRRRADRVINVQTFGTENAADLPAGSRPTALFAELDAAMRNLYARNPDKLAAWKSATHVERAAKKTPPPPAPAPPAP